jgi:hypothetical protein
MRKLWLLAAMAVSAAAMALPASAGPIVNGIPPHGIHGIIYHPCHGRYRCCHRWGPRCGPHGIIIGRPVIGRPIIGRRPIGVIGLRPVRPIGVRTHGIGPVGPVRGGLVNGVPVQEQVQH